MLEKFGFTSNKKVIKSVDEFGFTSNKKVIKSVDESGQKSEEEEQQINCKRKGFSRMHERSIERKSKRSRLSVFSSTDENELKYDECVQMQNTNQLAKGTYNKLDIEELRTSSDEESDLEELEPPEVTLKQLNQEQKQVLKLLKDGENVFLTGVGGTGKTVLLKFIQFCSPAGHTFFTASTGLAACAIGGTTLHSFAGIGLGNGPHKIILDRVMRNENTKRRWRRCKVLIIDEISMISGELFNLIDLVAKAVRADDRPFGGIQLVLSGDFLQLPPVCRIGTASFAFESQAWKKADIKVVELTQVFRQRDEIFVKLLYQIRFGVLNNNVLTLLQERLKPIIPNDATLLHARRDGAARDNKRKLDAIEAELYEFTAEDETTPENKRLFERLVKQCQATQKLELKIGAKIVLLKKIDDNLPNGTLGRVVDFKAVGDEGITYPVVRFQDRRKSQHIIEPVAFEIANGERKIGKRWQIPLLLGWSLTIHKSQGMSLENVFVQLKDCFESGQAYVALSRCRCLNKLYIADRRLNRTCFKANKKAVEFYQSLDSFNPGLLEGNTEHDFTLSPSKKIRSSCSPKANFEEPKNGFTTAAELMSRNKKASVRTFSPAVEQNNEEALTETKLKNNNAESPFLEAICKRHGCPYSIQPQVTKGAYLLSCTNTAQCVYKAIFKDAS